MKKIKLTESDLYRIVRRVLLEQEEEKRSITFSPGSFASFITSSSGERFVRTLNNKYDEVIVNGELDLDETPIQFLPNNLIINGSLSLWRCGNLEFLPDNLVINGDLTLSACENLQFLPSNLVVNGDMSLMYTPIKFLPDNFEVGGGLNLYGTQIQSLPDNLYVERDLQLGGTQIKSLPDNLYVGGEIYGTKLKKSSELKEQEPTGNQAYPAVTKWDSGVKRGPANPTNPKQKWSETYPIKRGKANTIDQKNKWSTDLTRGKANTLL